MSPLMQCHVSNTKLRFHYCEMPIPPIKNTKLNLLGIANKRA